jgi:hypothetical protein
MASLAWLLIPLLAAIGAGLWGSWAGRNRKAAGDGIELAGYARFRAAMEKSEAAMDVSDVDVAIERSGAAKKSPSEAV